MIYRILQILAKLTLLGYFRKVRVIGKENIPLKGPYIFVANHPSAFMDPIVVATSLKTPLYFIAAGEYVGKRFKGWFFQKILHMIPVYRPSTRPEDTHKNKDMFVRCYEHLNQKGALLIFPEGISITEKKLKPLKTGAVRIAIGAEKLRDYELGVSIVPIGLNYSSPHEFRSDLFVKIGKPIKISDFRKITSANEIEVTREITTAIEQELQENILHLNYNEDENMFLKLDLVYGRTIKEQFEIKFEEQDREFSMHKDVIAAIEYYKAANPSIYQAKERELDEYLSSIHALGLKDKDIAVFKERISYRRVFSFILGLPFFIFGVIHNIIPYKLVGIIQSKIKIDVTFTGSITIAIALFIFLFWYIAVGLSIYSMLGWIGLVYPIFMYSTGIYALIYLTAITQSKERNKLRRTYLKQKNEINSIRLMRKNLIISLNELRSSYLDRNN